MPLYQGATGGLIRTAGGLAKDPDCCCGFGVCNVCFPPGVAIDLSLTLSGLLNSTCVPDPGICTLEFTHANLNGSYAIKNSLMNYVTTGGSPAGNRADPGIIWEKTTCTDGVARETYVYGLQLAVDCISHTPPVSCFQYFRVHTQTWRLTTSGAWAFVGISSFGGTRVTAGDIVPACRRLLESCYFGLLQMLPRPYVPNCSGTLEYYDAYVSKA